MHNKIRIYECRCGQYTPVDTSAQVPVCSRCGSPRFKQILWFQNDANRGGTRWLRAHYQSEQGPSGGSLATQIAQPLSADVEEEETRRLDIGLARALLKHLEMLKRGDAICEQHYEQETQKVLKRVIRELRELHAVGESKCV